MRTLDQITELELSHEDLQALARQGFVATQRRGARITYKLRFRRGRKQQVRCLGSDPQRAAEVEAALRAWQTPRRLKRELRTLVVAGRALRRSIRPRLKEDATQAGFKFHGRRLRKPRSAVRDSPEAGSSCRE